MAATNQTSNYGLPQWLGSDKLERTDMNTAMAEIDDNLNLAQDLATKAGGRPTYFSTGDVVTIIRDLITAGYYNASFLATSGVTNKPAIFASGNTYITYFSYAGATTVNILAFDYSATGTRFYTGHLAPSNVIVWRYATLTTE